MGCSTSSRVIVEEPSSKDPHHGTEANKQVKKEASLGTRGIISGRGPGIEDDSREGRLPEDCTQQIPSVKGENNEQNIDISDGLPMKPVSLPESERQTSSDILEELRMQGIIKTPGATSKNRIADDTMLVHIGGPLQKPPAKLEKLENKKKKEHNLTIDNTENKITFLENRRKPLI